MRGPWNEQPDRWLADLAKLILQEKISGKLPYELKRLADLYEGWPRKTAEQAEQTGRALKQDVLRVIRGRASSRWSVVQGRDRNAARSSTERS